MLCHFSRLNLLIYSIFILGWGLSSCSNPTEIGSSILANETVNLEFTDTLTIEMSTQRSDSALVYSLSSLATYFCGQLNDPVFGKTESLIYAQARPDFFVPNFPQLGGVDSFILVLVYDTANTYADINAPFTLEVNRLSESISGNSFYYSDTSFAAEAGLLAVKEFTPNFDSTIFIDFPSEIDIPIRDTSFFPHLRIPMPQELINEFVLYDSLTIANDSAFVEAFKGLELKGTGNTNAILGFDLADVRSGLFMYYTLDTIQRQYQFNLLQGIKTMNYRHDYSGTQVEEALESLEEEREFAYVQGLAGTEIRIQFPGIQELGNIVVNKAELEITLGAPENDQLSLFSPAPQLILNALEEDGSLSFIPDVELGIVSGRLDIIFGGGYEEEGQRYVMDISNHFQRMVEGEVTNELALTVFPRTTALSRSVINTKRSVEGKPVLRLNYTLLEE